MFLKSPANPDLLYIIFFLHNQLTITVLLVLIFGSKVSKMRTTAVSSINEYTRKWRSHSYCHNTPYQRSVYVQRVTCAIVTVHHPTRLCSLSPGNDSPHPRRATKPQQTNKSPHHTCLQKAGTYVHTMCSTKGLALRVRLPLITPRRTAKRKTRKNFDNEIS